MTFEGVSDCFSAFCNSQMDDDDDDNKIYIQQSLFSLSRIYAKSVIKNNEERKCKKKGKLPLVQKTKRRRNLLKQKKGEKKETVTQCARTYCH